MSLPGRLRTTTNIRPLPAMESGAKAGTPGFSDLDFSNLSLCVGGGAPVQEAVSDRWHEVTGKHILEGYGLSETSPVLTLNPPARADFSGCIGIPLPSTDISLRDDKGLEVEPGWRRSSAPKAPRVMSGY